MDADATPIELSIKEDAILFGVQRLDGSQDKSDSQDKSEDFLELQDAGRLATIATPVNLMPPPSSWEAEEGREAAGGD